MKAIAVRHLVPRSFEFSCPACGFPHEVTLQADSLGVYAEFDQEGCAFSRHCISCCALLVLPAFIVQVDIVYFDRDVSPEETDAPP